MTIAALQKGDELAFQELFYEFHRKIYGYVLSKTQSQYLAEEVTQTTFIKLWRYRHTLRPDLPVSQQIFRIAKTSLIDALRSQSNQTRLMHAVHAETGPAESQPVSLENKERLEQAQALIRSLPPVRQRVFQLSREEGRTMREIAEMLSISVKSVEKHIARTLQQLRHMIWMLGLLLVSIF